MRRPHVPERISGPVRQLTAGVRRALSVLARWRDKIPQQIRSGALITVIALIGVLVGIQLGGQDSTEVGPFHVNLSVSPSLYGESALDIPPLGTITVDSHDSPVKLTGRIDSLDDAETRALLSDPQRIEQASNDAIDELFGSVVKVAIRAAIAGIAGALILGLIFFRNLRRALLSGAVAFAVLLGTGVATAATWSPESIREPRYEGLLTNVPAIIGDAQNIYDRFGEYRGELIRILTNMGRVYTNLSTLPTYQPDPNTIRVLHITDLHLNPNSYPVIKAIVDQFQVQVVVDTGDLTDWGSKLENSYASGIGSLGVPYVFIRGNHDSAVTAAAVARQPNAIVLENQVREVNGLTFAGIGDPRFTPDKSDGSDGRVQDDDPAVLTAGEQLAATIEAYNDQFADDSNNGGTKDGGDAGTDPRVRPDGSVNIALVHDPGAAPKLDGKVPLVLSGHTHKRNVSTLDNKTTVMVEGSTGARGLGGLSEENPTALQMSLLYFSPAGQLQAYDGITVSGAGQSRVELERTVLKK